MKLIVGLGNPGKQYAHTRHNAGFLAVNALAAELGLNWRANKKLCSDLAKGRNAILLKPLTFMNESGAAAAAALAYFHLDPRDLTVIHDDLDITLGKFKISADSRSAGHKGVQSIIERLGTKSFKRIRIGIKPPDTEKIPIEAAEYVLKKFRPEELAIINGVIAAAVKKLK